MRNILMVLVGLIILFALIFLFGCAEIIPDCSYTEQKVLTSPVNHTLPATKECPDNRFVGNWFQHVEGYKWVDCGIQGLKYQYVNYDINFWTFENSNVCHYYKQVQKEMISGYYSVSGDIITVQFLDFQEQFRFSFDNSKLLLTNITNNFIDATMDLIRK